MSGRGPYRAMASTGIARAVAEAALVAPALPGRRVQVGDSAATARRCWGAGAA